MSAVKGSGRGEHKDPRAQGPKGEQCPAPRRGGHRTRLGWWDEQQCPSKGPVFKEKRSLPFL